MSLIDELIEAAAGMDIEAAKKRQANLQQHFLNVRARAAMAGLADMGDMIEAEKKLNEQDKPK